MTPRAQVLSNGQLVSVVTESGGGYTRFAGLALTRWAPDRVRDADGEVLYLRDLDSGRFWSLGFQPAPGEPDEHTLDMEHGQVVVHRTDGDLRQTLEICVSPYYDAALRRLTLANGGTTARRLEITTYAELVLNSPAADAAHPAFSKLFVQTELLPRTGAVLARRRPRSPEDEPLWAVHLLREARGHAGAPGLEVETDRMRFIGRGRRLSAPAALDAGATLSGSLGNVLDPVAALRRVVELRPGESTRLVTVLAAADARDDAEALARRYAPPLAGVDAFNHAQERARNLLADLRIPAGWVGHIPALTGELLFGGSPSAGAAAIRETSGQAALRALGVAGPAPLVLADTADRSLAAAAVAIAGYWRRQGLAVDLLVLAAEGADANAFRELARAPVPKALGRTLVLEERELAPGMRAFVRAAARVRFDAAQAQAADASPRPVPVVATQRSGRYRAARPADAPAAAPGGGGAGGAEPLRVFNGRGGFSEDGTEYVIRMEPGPTGPVLPPLPWTHVVADEQTGFLVSERGAGCTWSGNSRENRLTPWLNDPVSDPQADALYLRDEDAGIFWSPTPGPVPAPAAYEARWGFGRALWRTSAFGLDQEVVAFVPRGGPLRIVRLRVTNHGARPRRLSAFSYVEWVLGVLPRESPLLRTTIDGALHAVLAVNPGNGAFAGRVAFAAAVPPLAGAGVDVSADRHAFLGARGDVSDPAALRADRLLDGRAGAGGDPCAAFRVELAPAPGETVECAFLLGEAEDEAAARAAIARYADPGTIEAELANVRGFWTDLTGRLHVQTPSPALDLMVNGWLTYQDLCCRIEARSAFYQSGGAFGFRDQLQDAAALIYVEPALTRRQILLHAAHQFVEGDVLHWWHPPTGQGIRTRFSDDLLWLPYVAAFYVAVTGDAGVLDERAGFVAARPLEPGEDEAFLQPADSGEAGSIYEHCCRALDRSLTVGPHGLPLIGTGDWNDGMNRVGREGRGESVWLGFFLYAILEDFAGICEARDDVGRADRYRRYRTHLGSALNEGGWDGGWYRRGFYDDGAALGSAASDECRIDAIAQAWAVFAGAAPTDRAEQALDALERFLVREDQRLIALLTPPFDRTPHDPGYIKGYVPGVRENGGQYTHGALWAVRALAEAGRAERAATLLEMLSPVSHARTPEEVAVYQVEPYVVAADVYAVAPHVGRGGWTWYTGSAGWMLRVALESVLGLTVAGGRTLRLCPCIPAAWPGFALRYRLPGDDATYDIRVTRGSGAPTVATLDGLPLGVAEGGVVAPLLRDGAVHELRVELGPDVGPAYEPR